jgi:hypothetical protein
MKETYNRFNKPEGVLFSLNDTKKADKSDKGKKILKVFIIAAYIAALVGPSYYFYRKYQGATEGVSQLKTKEVSQLISKISKIAELPQDEEPTVASISDKDKLKDNAFFSKAENGDKVLIYAGAKRAYLYRPSTGRIVDIVTINIEGQSQQSTPAIQIEQ